MDNVARQKVDVVVEQLNARVSDALAAQLVEFGVLDPLHTLRDRRLVQVQLKLFDQVRKVAGMKGNHVLGDAILGFRLAALDGLQNA